MRFADPVLERRVLPLQGARNLRDLGGYAAGEHTVKWDKLFRSGSMTGLTQADWNVLYACGVRAVFHLRTTHERENEPFKWRDADGLTYFSRDYLTSFGELRRVMQADLPTRDAARAAMFAGYRELPFEQAPAYRQLFAHLKTGGPVIFNCSAGKDRAGTAAALILSALGVPREAVIADFILTDEVSDLRGALMAQSGGAGLMARQPPEVAEAILKADPDYMDVALNSINERYGSLENYLRDVLDVGEADLGAIRTHFLD